MKYQIKSAEVLNEADRFQRMLDWELFTSAQEIQLWHAHVDDVTWRPGDFLYDYPGLGIGCSDPGCIACRERHRLGSGALPNPNYEGNCVRPMMEIINDNMGGYKSICCDVWWNRYMESSCWMCGKEYPLLEREKKPRFTSRGGICANPNLPDAAVWFDGSNSIAEIIDVQENPQGMIVALQFNETALEAWRHATESVGQQFARLSRSMPRRNGFDSAMQYLDEYIAFDLEMTQTMNLASIDPEFVPEPYFYEPRGVSIHNPFIDPPNPFQRPNIRGPIWGTAALYDPNGEPLSRIEINRMYGKIPRNWRQMRAEIPPPQLPEPRDYSDWTPGERNGPPTTPNWRNR